MLERLALGAGPLGKASPFPAPRFNDNRLSKLGCCPAPSAYSQRRAPSSCRAKGWFAGTDWGQRSLWAARLWRTTTTTTTDAGCFNNDVLKAWTPELSTEFAEAVTAGEDREISDDEALFKILDRGLRQLDACNSGFRREDAPLHVIFVSDEPERSQEQAASWTYDYWLGEYNKVVPESLLTLSGVVDTEDCNEGDAGYSEAIAATGGLSMSICTTDWAQYAEDIALATLSNAWQFELTEQAASGSIQVQVDGTTSSRWTFNPGSNSVQMNGLQEASEVVITYSVQEECP